MLLNFALDALGTSVSCNRVSTDGFECNNLISSDPHLQRKGFLTEHFIKPPVDLTFVFPCHVNIFCVLLDPFVRAQQSSQIEVFCASKPMPKTKHGQRRAEESKKITSTHQDEPLPLFYPVSKMNAPNQTNICFYNGRFPTPRSGLYQDIPRSYELHAKAEMRHGKQELLISATHLTIRISRTQNGSTSALNNIEIWGTFASGVDKAVEKSISAKYQAMFVEPSLISAKSPDILSPGHKYTSGSTKTNISNTNGQTKKNTASQSFDNVQIPEEFMDPLTCEIMSIPMLLPSGKNVDKSTLERYCDCEASHGRQPRDPFTGLEFHSKTKPVPNGLLKARIDHFLSEKRDSPATQSLPRTVRSEKVSTSLFRKRKLSSSSSLDVSSLVNDAHSRTHLCRPTAIGKNNKDSSGSGLTQMTTQSLSTCGSPFLTPSPFIKSSSSSSLTLLSSINPGNQHCPAKPINNPLHPSKPPRCQGQIQTTAAGPTGQTHELSLRDSLDNALNALFGSSSANTEESDINVEVRLSDCDIKSSCSKCRKDFTKGSLLAYSIPCFHFLCRACLLSMRSESDGESYQCAACGASFQTSDVVRRH